MFSHVTTSFGRALFIGTMALALVVPVPWGNCCRVAQAAAKTGPACCQKHAPRHSHHSLPAIMADCGTQVACQCACCRTGSQRTATPDAPQKAHIEHATAVVAIAAILPPADATAGIASGRSVVFSGPIVPHRILHCSWII